MPSKKLHLNQDEIARPFGGERSTQFPPILTVAQTAALLGRSRKTIYDWMTKGRLDGTYRKRGKHALFWRDRVIDTLFNGKDWN